MKKSVPSGLHSLQTAFPDRVDCDKVVVWLPELRKALMHHGFGGLVRLEEGGPLDIKRRQLVYVFVDLVSATVWQQIVQQPKKKIRTILNKVNKHSIRSIIKKIHEKNAFYQLIKQTQIFNLLMVTSFVS